MKNEIHPTWHTKVVVTCACGESFVTGSTAPSLHVDICSKCHPLYTGDAKLIDIEGVVSRFQKRAEKSEKLKSQSKEKKKTEEEKEVTKRPRTLKEMLDYAKKHPSL